MKITKTDIDDVFNHRYGELERKYREWKPKSRHNIDKDVLAFVYEDMLHTINKIPDKNSIYKWMVQSLRCFMFYGNTKYTREYKNYNGGLDVGDWIYNTLDFSDEMGTLDSPDPHLQLIQLFNDLNIDLVDKLTFQVLLEGHSTLTKFTRHTGIPKSSSYRIIKAVQNKLKIINEYYMKDPKHKYELKLDKKISITRKIKGVGSYTLRGNSHYTQRELHNLYPYFPNEIVISDIESEQKKVEDLTEDPKSKKSKVGDKLKKKTKDNGEQ